MDNSQSRQNSNRTNLDLLEYLLYGDADIGTFEELLQGLQAKPDTQSSKAIAGELVGDLQALPQEIEPKEQTYPATWTDQERQETTVRQTEEPKPSYHRHNSQNQSVVTDDEKNLELQEPNGKHP